MAATGLNATSGQETQQVQQFLSPPRRASIGGLVHKLNLFLCPCWAIVAGGPDYQDAERSCSHLGTMVEFAVALGSKLDVINKHSFNNFRLRVGEAHTLLGQCGNSSLQVLQLICRPPPPPQTSSLGQIIKLLV